MLSSFVFMCMILVDFFIESSNCLRAKVVCCDWGPYFLMRDLLNVALAHSDDCCTTLSRNCAALYLQKRHLLVPAQACLL